MPPNDLRTLQVNPLGVSFLNRSVNPDSVCRRRPRVYSAQTAVTTLGDEANHASKRQGADGWCITIKRNTKVTRRH